MYHLTAPAPTRAITVEETALGYLLESLETLKGAGCDVEDAGTIWCADWQSAHAISETTAEKKAHVAKVALRRMKAIAKVISTISTSLNDAIERVTSESSSAFRSVGFASLPDELVARIIELCCSGNTRDFNYHSVAFEVSRKLASVCTRFRHIALHLPLVWEDVRNLYKEDCTLQLKARCINPLVYIKCWTEEERAKLGAFIELLHPASQWRGLRLECRTEDVSGVLQVVSRASGGHFPMVESLAIDPVRCNGPHTPVPVAMPGTNLSTSDSDLIASWTLPSLRELRIQNFIPTAVHGPNLRRVCIELIWPDGAFAWDLHALRRFLSSVHLTESLSLTLGNATSSTTIFNIYDGPIAFPNLDVLTVVVWDSTEPVFVADVLDTIDTGHVSTLKATVEMNEENETRGTYDWLYTFFNVEKQDSLAPRNFKNLKTLHLKLNNGKTMQWPGESTIFRDIPGIQNLYLELPFSCTLDLPTISKHCKDLRSIFLQDFPSLRNLEVLATVLHYMGAYKGAYKGNEKTIPFDLKFEDFDRLRPLKKRLEELLGPKLIWSSD